MWWLSRTEGRTGRGEEEALKHAATALPARIERDPVTVPAVGATRRAATCLQPSGTCYQIRLKPSFARQSRWQSRA
jgi:hypothetical protein